MDSLFYWTGIIFWFGISLGLLFLVVLIMVHGVNCIRFVRRCLKSLPHGGYQQHLPLRKTAIKHFIHLFFGICSRPDYIRNPDTNDIVFWPGKENDPRYKYF